VCAHSSSPISYGFHAVVKGIAKNNFVDSDVLARCVIRNQIITFEQGRLRMCVVQTLAAPVTRPDVLGVLASLIGRTLASRAPQVATTNLGFFVSGDKGFRVFMPSSSSAIFTGGFMASRTVEHYTDRHLVVGTLCTLIGLAAVCLLANYLSAIQ
jgi:hypothetical protein